MQKIRWDNPEEKESHPGKTLKKHLEEIKNIFNSFADFYCVDNKYKDIILQIIEYHDMGKLHPDWSIYNKKIRSHAEQSIYYMLQQNNILKEFEKFQNYYLLILYFILKHHSPLYDMSSSCDVFLKQLCDDIIRKIIKLMKLEERIELVDTFGMFKVADILSASNSSFEPVKPPITQEKIRNILSSKSTIDEDRFREQMKLAELPDISILRAYTGWGKTDSSLLFFTNKNVNKIFYVFPTITAINKFYDKLESHFKDNVEKYFYMYEYELVKKGESNESVDIQLSSLIASHFMKPIMLTTVDQLLLTFLQIGKYYTKRFMFRNAGIVIDEVHLINFKMLAILLYFLKKFVDLYKLKILFMSATLSDALIQLIKNKLSINNVGVIDRNDKYKELRRIRYELDSNTLQYTLEKIINEFKKDKKVLVVSNTVENAISLAKMFENEINENDLIVLHARFMYKDRVEKEEKIEELRYKPHILLTTQVCEVSLDASYDVLFTETAPLPSLIQRFGRVNRYGKKTDYINAFICKEYKSTSKYPYEDVDLCNARKILEELYPIENEFQLISRYNEIESFESLLNTMEGVERELDLDAYWGSDNRTAYFFSFKLGEEEAMKLLNFRDEVTLHILPDPECIDDERTKNELSNMLAKLDNACSYEERNNIFKKLRGYYVAVPISWVQNMTRDNDGIPRILFKNKIYNSKYGFVNRKSDNII